MTAADMKSIETLLKNYDSYLRDKAEHYANMMADWADVSEDETRRYANMYSTVRVERQRLHDSLFVLEMKIKQSSEEESAV